MFGNFIKLLLLAVIVASVALFARDRLHPAAPAEKAAAAPWVPAMPSHTPEPAQAASPAVPGARDSVIPETRIAESAPAAMPEPAAETPVAVEPATPPVSEESAVQDKQNSLPATPSPAMQ